MKLKTADLIIYGLVLIQPIAPVGIFGIANVLSHGHVTSSILLAMVAMMLTALSYGRLAALYPSSAYLSTIDSTTGSARGSASC